MILLRSIYYKNFTSAGNSGIKIDLTGVKTTLISGFNGAGKSSLCEAIVFALYGKSYRGVNKEQLINSVNERECIVEIEFDIGSKKYKVRRGIKPAVFDIYENDSLLKKDSSSRDFQSYLEDMILRMSYKTFCQVVLLGSANYTPFMRLTAADRRSIVENLLDISVFSEMNRVLKGRIAAWKDNYDAVERRIDATDTRIGYQKKIIQRITQDSATKTASLRLELSNVKEHVSSLSVNKTSLNAAQEALQPVIEQIGKLNQQATNLRTKMDHHAYHFKHLDKQQKEIEAADICHECEQTIDRETKDKIVKSKLGGAIEHRAQHTALKEELETVEKQLSELSIFQQQFNNNAIALIKVDTQIKSLSSRGLELMEEIRLTAQETGDLDKELAELYRQEGQLATEEERKRVMFEEREVNDIAARLLKDSGIKTTIIRQYIPLFNQYVNKYLTNLNFFVKFTLDENFNETIIARGLEEFTYNSFSMGERMRIDLAVLFAWRDLARVKNSISCNLLALDEIFDSSLDGSGADDLMNILGALNSTTNVFVISHRSDQLAEKLDRHLQFSKEKGFTVINEI